MPGNQPTVTLSRRQFLAAGAALPLVFGGSEAAVIVDSYIAQVRAMGRAALQNDDWLEDNKRKVQQLSLGTSFAPEQWSGGERRDGKALAGLRFAIDDLGMRDIRLAIRWSRVDSGEGSIDLRPYMQYLQLCIDRGVRLALNVGPIKVFRWPEIHVPGYLKTRYDLPPAGSTVRLDSELARVALDYLDRLIAALKRELGEATLASTAVLQTENEPYYPLGPEQWRLGNDYLDATVEYAAPHFPAAKLLVSSAARLNLASVQDHFGRLLARDETWKGRLTMGFDFHFQTPERDSKPIVRHLDPITFANLWTQSVGENRRLAAKLGYGIEVTEGQAEPYSYLKEPGNSVRLYRYMLQRCMDEVLLPDEPGLVRVWGVEELAKQVLTGSDNPEHRQIVDLTQMINGQTRISPIRA